MTGPSRAGLPRLGRGGAPRGRGARGQDAPAAEEARGRVGGDVAPHEAEPEDALELLKKRLEWKPEDDAVARRTGCSLLMYAALADDAQSLRSLLQHPARANLNMAICKPDLARTPLMCAMAFGSFDITKQLLEAILLSRWSHHRVQQEATSLGAALLVPIPHEEVNV